jgi:hypothetical protein
VSLAERTQVEVVATLDERAERIIAHISDAALNIGAELIAAKAEHPREFLQWVATRLPFGIDKAERLMAITRAFASADPAVLEALPPAWTALFELARLPIDVVAESIESGAITPQMTVQDARQLVSGHRDVPEKLPERPTPGPAPGFDPTIRLPIDHLASELVRCDRQSLSEPVEYLLRKWLDPKPQMEAP